MSYTTHTIVSFLLVSALDALLIQPAQSLNSPVLNLSPPLQYSTGPSAPQTTASPQLNSSLNLFYSVDSNEIRTECNSEYYGVPLIASCLDVYRQMTDSDKISEFGDRTKGVFDYALPYRLSSSQ